jgi:anti-sigma factor RsiW
MFGAFVRRMTTLYWGHPSDSLLLSLHDGEISDKRRGRLEAHLNRCPRCQARAARMAQDWRDFAELTLAADAGPASAEEELITKIQSSIHAWSAANLPASSQPEAQAFAQTETGRQVAAVLGVYLGQRAAAALLHAGGTAQISKQQSVAQFGSTLRVLLGRQSARAVEKKLLRIMSQLPDSAGGPSAS